MIWNLEEVKVIKDEKHSSKIMLNDDIGVKMKYPDIKDVNIIDTDSAITGMNIIKNCIDMIFTKEETHERDTFSEGELDEFIDSLNSVQFKRPELELNVKFVPVLGAKLPVSAVANNSAHSFNADQSGRPGHTSST